MIHDRAYPTSSPEEQDRIYVQAMDAPVGVILTITEYALSDYDVAEYIALLASRPRHHLDDIFGFCGLNDLNFYPYDHRNGPPPIRIELPEVRARVAFWCTFN